MPTYSYRCTECDTAFDIVQSFTDDSLTVCPTCQGKLRKLFAAVGVTFNGSGFYRNDARADATSSAQAGKSGTSREKSAAGSEKPKEKSGSETSTPAPAKVESSPQSGPKHAASTPAAKKAS